MPDHSPAAVTDSCANLFGHHRTISIFQHFAKAIPEYCPGEIEEANVCKHAFELVSTYRRHHFTLEEEECWERGGKEHCDKDDGWVSTENAFSYTYAGKLTLALHLDFTDDPIVQSLQNGGAVGNLWYDEDFKASAYVGGEVIWKPSSDFEFYLFGGSQKSGIVCTGGACRTVPSFTGVKTRVTVNF